jgi:hypothetical protein
VEKTRELKKFLKPPKTGLKTIAKTSILRKFSF